jgi:excisionase family DNA binding protein
MPRHRFDRRKIKRNHNYTIEQAARTIGASKGTIRRWLEKRLPAIRDRKPYLILGEDLIDYLDRQARPKQPCPPGTCYCVKCKTAKRPAGDIAEFVPVNARSGNLRGICPDCGSLAHRRHSYAQLEAIRSFLDVTIVEPVTRLNDGSQHSTNDHLQKEPSTHA